MSELAWQITAYMLTFAGFLLMGGRLADVLNAGRVFEFGFASMAVVSLVISFMTNKYAFLCLRAICGVSGALTMPTGINLTVRMYPIKAEQQWALTLFATAGAIGNICGFVLAGTCSLKLERQQNLNGSMQAS